MPKLSLINHLSKLLDVTGQLQRSVFHQNVIVSLYFLPQPVKDLPVNLINEVTARPDLRLKVLTL